LKLARKVVPFWATLMKGGAKDLSTVPQGIELELKMDFFYQAN
jgi:hypothetical protein